MTDKHRPRAPELKPRIPMSFLTGFIFMVAVMLALPITQHMSPPEVFPGWYDFDGGTIRPPDEFVVPPPPPPVDKEKDIELEEDKPEPLRLTHLDVFYNPDITSFASTDWRVYSGFMPSEEEMVHWIGDLTNPPHPLRRAQPVYPAQLKRAGIEGTVVVMFIVRSDGTVSHIEIKEASHREFGESVMRSVRKWFFEPGEKDGRAVHTRVRQVVPFRIN